jgi:hypothetical protein
VVRKWGWWGAATGKRYSGSRQVARVRVQERIRARPTGKRYSGSRTTRRAPPSRTATHFWRRRTRVGVTAGEGGPGG